MKFLGDGMRGRGRERKRRDVKDIHIARLSLLSSALADLGRETGLDGGD
jgi:hypothetical protein